MMSVTKLVMVPSSAVVMYEYGQLATLTAISNEIMWAVEGAYVGKYLSYPILGVVATVGTEEGAEVTIMLEEGKLSK